MKPFRLACQTITWGEGQSAHFAEVFAGVAQAGFAGVEIGFRHIRATPPATLAALLKQQKLLLLATHLGGNLLDPAGAGQERRIVDEVIDYLQAMPSGLLMYSGLKFENAGQFDRDFAMLNRAAEDCHARGIKLLYHNHDWEFANGAQVMNAILKDGSPKLGLCPDLGWVMKGGGDVLAFLQSAQGRIGAVHFKDFGSRHKGVVDTVLLGQGAAPLREAAAWIRQNLPGMWIIAEQDQANQPPAQAAARNGEFLKGLF